MRRHISGSGLVLVVCAMLLAGASPAFAGTWVSSQLTRDTPAQYQADTDGATVVWTDRRNGNPDIYMYDLATGVETRVTTNTAVQEKPKVSGDYIVWVDYRQGGPDIYLYRISSGHTDWITSFSIMHDYNDDPQIDGDWVVFEVVGEGIQYYSISGTTAWVVPGATAAATDPDVDGGKIVYSDLRSGNRDIYQCQPVGAGYTENQITTAAGDQWSPAIDGNVIVWEDLRNGSDNGDIYGYSSAAATEFALCTNGAYQGQPRISGPKVIWNDWRSGDCDTYIGDVDTAASQLLAGGPNHQQAGGVGGDFVAWASTTLHPYSGDFTSGDIFVTNINPSREYIRTEGATRFDTAVMAMAEGWPLGASTWIVATGRNWPDALGGAALAGVYSAPIVLVDTNAVPPSVISQLMANPPGKIVILGGTSAVSSDVESTLHSYVADTTRISGLTRYETANLIAAEVKGLSTFHGTHAYVATGLNFPDALAASPIMYYGENPLYLVGPTGLSAATKAAMSGSTIITILGSTSVVSEAVEQELVDTGATVQRLQGADRYATAAAIANYGNSQYGIGMDQVGFAVGTNFPDALAAGPFQGKNGRLLLLTPADSLDHAPRDWLVTNKTAIPTGVRFFGGPTALSDYVKGQVALILQ